MTLKFDRRTILAQAAAFGGASLLAAPAVRAQSSGILARMRDENLARVAIPQTPPWSEIQQDGTITGIAPEVLMPALNNLGITNVEPIPTTYSQLIPGLMAGRWDIIGACLTVSQTRCEAVRFLAPINAGYLSVMSRTGELETPPLSVKEVADFARAGGKVATGAGGYQIPMLRSMVSDDNLLMFDDVGAIVEAVDSGRAEIGLNSYYGMRQVRTDNEMSFTPPMEDTGLDESGMALRHSDVDLFEALDAEMLKLKASGLVEEINIKYGYTYEAEIINPITGQYACENANT